MACILTAGRALGCKTSVGGLKAIYFADYGTLGTVTGGVSGADITGISGANIWYKYDIKGASSLETSITSSNEAGTTFYTQTLNLVLPILDSATQAEIAILAVSRPHIAVEDYNGNVFLVGLEHGADTTGGTILTGAAMGDASSFNLTMVANERNAPNFTTGGVLDNLNAAAQIDPNA